MAIGICCMGLWSTLGSTGWSMGWSPRCSNSRRRPTTSRKWRPSRPTLKRCLSLTTRSCIAFRCCANRETQAGWTSSNQHIFTPFFEIKTKGIKQPFLAFIWNTRERKRSSHSGWGSSSCSAWSTILYGINDSLTQGMRRCCLGRNRNVRGGEKLGAAQRVVNNNPDT